MDITGHHIIGSEFSKKGKNVFQAVNPSDDTLMAPEFADAIPEEIDAAFEAAWKAFETYRELHPERKATFLNAIADAIENLGDPLIRRCHAETALPEARLIGERGRTVNQLRMFAEVVREGSWVEARLETPLPDRHPAPRPDIRRMLIPLGPVAVFGASNFPLAFSVAGGDTASALAAGCPVIFKAHPYHPGTCELVGRAILSAIHTANMPPGVFSLLHGLSNDVGRLIVEHDLCQAVGFTGSFQGGTAIFKNAMARRVPIPVYAEMGSINPVFILPDAMKKHGWAIAKGLAGSVTLGAGQFCTNPGVFVVMNVPETQTFFTHLKKELQAIQPGTMLSRKIKSGFDARIHEMSHQDGVEVLTTPSSDTQPNTSESYLLKTTIQAFLKTPSLQAETFGPSTLGVIAESREDLCTLADTLEGQLTATIHGTEEDFKTFTELPERLSQRVGRLIFNGFPTGVEVCHAMHHGGPFPATTDVRSTSVGSAAIKRFARPICYQNMPHNLLPLELRDENPLHILRMVDGQFKR